MELLAAVLVLCLVPLGTLSMLREERSGHKRRARPAPASVIAVPDWRREDWQDAME